MIAGWTGVAPGESDPVHCIMATRVVERKQSGWLKTDATSIHLYRSGHISVGWARCSLSSHASATKCTASWHARSSVMAATSASASSVTARGTLFVCPWMMRMTVSKAAWSKRGANSQWRKPSASGVDSLQSIWYIVLAHVDAMARCFLDTLSRSVDGLPSCSEAVFRWAGEPAVWTSCAGADGTYLGGLDEPAESRRRECLRLRSRRRLRSRWWTWLFPRHDGLG